jgi:hypothetical protein
MDELIREAMRRIASIRWAKATAAQRAAQARKMVAGRRRARKHREAKIRARGLANE